MVYSHNHWDHIAGGKVLKDQGAKFISHENRVAAFRRIPSPSVVMPDITFSKAHALKLGGTTIELRYHGRNHGNCLISMRLPREKVLFVVDIVAPKSVGFRDLPNFYPRDWIRTLKELETLDFDRVIPGHGPPAAPRSAVREQREYLEDLAEAVRKAIGQRMTRAQARKAIKLPKYEKWGNYKEWLPMNVDRFYHEQAMGWSCVKSRSANLNFSPGLRLKSDKKPM